MHVLPLPFGMVLAVLPRRDADRLRQSKPPITLHRNHSVREQVLSDIRYADVRQHVI